MTQPNDGYEELLETRSKSQSILVRLHRLASQHENALLDNRLADRFLWLVGAAFSLWRAAFLTKTQRSRCDMLHQARDFLQKLIEDNSIGYPQDKTHRDWAGGYYLNSAVLRLSQADQQSDRARALLERCQMLDEPLLDSWRNAHARLVILVDELEATLHSGSPNNARPSA